MTSSIASQALLNWWDHGARDPQRPLLLLAGPCVLEDHATNLQIAELLAEAADAAGMTFAFKASFDKANRSSIHSDRGPGIEEGLRALEAIGETVGVPLVTDVHEPSQAAACAEVVDLS